MTWRSHARTAAATASRSDLRSWSPGTVTTSRLRPGGRNAEWIALAMDDERRHRHRVELRQATLRTLPFAAGRLEGVRLALDRRDPGPARRQHDRPGHRGAAAGAGCV